MNDRVILSGVVIIIANMFLIFAGTFNHFSAAYGYYVFAGIIVVGIAVGLAGVFLSPPKQENPVPA